MLDNALKDQLRAYLEHLKSPITLVASLDESKASKEMRALLEELEGASNRITVRYDGGGERRPSFSIEREGESARIAFAGLPLGHEFTSLILALLHASGHPPRVAQELIEAAEALHDKLHFETYFSQSCQNCPDVVQALNLIAARNPNVEHVAIDGASFADEVEAREVFAVPSVFLNGEPFAQGRMTLEEILSKLGGADAAGKKERVESLGVMDLVVVGGGPAGASAALFAARKGQRVAIVADRIGGQLLDTLAIENYPGVGETEGPRLAADLEAQLRRYPIELLEGERVAQLQPAESSAEGAGVEAANHSRGEAHVLFLESGARLEARQIILAPGARYRPMVVPGEAEYRTRGVTNCPHCDGPLFKERAIAVVGGGNAGVEAALDLAGIVRSVTLLEREEELRADQVLQEKLAATDNARVVRSAAVKEVFGDGRRLKGLRYEDRVTGEVHELEVEGIFVQIGLVPNTDFLKGSVELNRFGEIVVDDRGRTSVAGIYGAGDATTAPYKQIAIAAGDGARAALTAFEDKLRAPREASMRAAS